MRNKLYLVKYEVIATSIKRALQTRGIVYEVSCTDKKEWPEEKTKKKVGFDKK